MNWERYHALVALDYSRQSQEALSGLQSLLPDAKSPEDEAAVVLAISACLRNLGHGAEARQTLRRARSIAAKDSECLAWVLFAEVCLDADEGNWKKALANIDALAAKFSPLFLLPENQNKSEHVQRIRGIALFELGRRDEARSILELAATRETERGRTLYYLARCDYELRDFERSKQCFREALELNLDPVYQASAHYLLGQIHYAQGQYAWALRELEWCLENDTQGSVPRAHILRGLAAASTALGLVGDAEKYSKML